VGEVVGEFGGVDCGAGDGAPEAETVCAGVIPDEVEGNAHEPGDRGAVAAELFSCGPGAEEGVLHEGVGEVTITQAAEQKAEDALAVEGVEDLNRG